MASYQDLETRLNVVEDKLLFILTTIKMSAMVPTGLLDAEGQASYQKRDGTLLEWYHTARAQALNVLKQSDGAEPPAEAKNDSVSETEQSNG